MQPTSASIAKLALSLGKQKNFLRNGEVFLFEAILGDNKGMSFIEDLRSLVESTQQIGDRRPNAAKTLTKIGDMATSAAKDRVVDTIVAQNLGLFPLAMRRGWQIADNISDARKWSEDAATERATNEFLRRNGDNGNVTMKKTDEKDEEGLAEGQDGNTAPVEQKDTEETKAPSYDIDEMAGEFILGAWGNGQDRIDNMINAGYSLDDYNKIQQRVNDAYASGRDLHEWTNKANAKLHYW